MFYSFAMVRQSQRLVKLTNSSDIQLFKMQLTLKQRYLQANAPQPPNFEEERTRNFEKLIVLISTTDRTKWLSTGFNCVSLIEAYKQVYGLTSQQFETILTILSNIGLKEEGLSTQTRVFIMRLINTLTEYQIKITQNFKVSNTKLLQLLDTLANEGLEGTLRNSDAVIEQLSKFILFFSRFGEEVVEEALNLSIEYNDIRYLVIFLRSIKTQAAALRLLAELFSDNNLWDRDCFWFYILSQIIKKFPRIDYSSYYQTIMQEVIRAFTTIVQGTNQDSLKKLTVSDPFLQIQPVLKSVALALAYLLLPNSQPQHVFIKSCIERLFCLVISSLDHINPPEYLNDLLGFVKVFVRAYLLRYRGERGLFLLVNEDSIEDYHDGEKKNLLIDQSIEIFFDNLWGEIIPKIVYLEDTEECKPSKIIAELCMYKPQKFLQLSLQSVLAVASRQDPTLISLHGTKITLLFLQQYVIIDRPQFLSIYIECCSNLLSVVQKLGVPDNLDIIELVFRTFLYVNEEQNNLTQVQNLIEDSMTLLLSNLDPMSIGLEGSTQGDQAQLYIDFGNIFFPFLLRLDKKQLQLFSQKFLFRLVSQIPEHEQAYEMITIALTFIDPKFSGRVFKHIFKELVSQQDEPKQPKKVVELSEEAKQAKIDLAKKVKQAIQQQLKDAGQDIIIQDDQINIVEDGAEEEEEEDPWLFIKQVGGSIHPRNEQALKWYSSLLQCIFQYHPENAIANWPDIEQLINLLLVKWEDQAYLQIALDIIYNLLLCLCKPHLSWQQFVKRSNGDYKTLKLNWQPLLPQAKNLIDQIFDKYFVDVGHFLKRIYNKQLQKNATDVTMLGDFQTYVEKNQNGDVIRIRRRNLKLVDYVLMPEVSNPEDAGDRRIIYRALSIQYTVLSALMLRVPFHNGLQNVSDFFTEERYLQLRPRTCEYLEWVLQLLGHFSLMAEQPFIKLFNFFWRESHDEVSYTTAISATNQKISPYYYPQLHRKKELLRSPFLLVNEAYLCHMVRLQFHLIIAPTAYLNNPRYLQSNFILGLSPLYEPNLHSYFPSYVEVHQYHRQLIAICRFHLDAANQQGYLFKLIKEQDAGTKQRYSTAVKMLIVGIKRLLNVFSDNCCMKDEFVRNTIFQLITLYKVLPKKNDKTLVYQIIYVLLVFSFDPICLTVAPEYSMSKYWTLRSQNSPQIAEYEIVSITETPNLNKIMEELDREEIQFLDMITANRGLKLTRSCSFQSDNQIPKQLERAVAYLIKKIEQGLPALQKDLGVYLLMVLLYSNCLHVDHPLISQLTILIFKLCQSQSTEIFDMSKTGFFHIVNRFNYHQKRQKCFKNVPVKRSWDQFLRMKHLGAQGINYQFIKCEKNQQNFYPGKELIQYDYVQLASDQTSPSYYNEKTMLSIFQDQQGFMKFLKNCSRDPDLKQSDTQAPETMVVSEDDFKSISSSAHKLMHFIWDCNPSKTPLFMGVLQRYSASPLNFYNRFFRKSIRIGGQKAREVCSNLTKRLRLGEPEQLRLSFYINCELMLRDPTEPMHKPFLDYLEECTKENFDFVLMGLYGIFTSNFVVAEKNYQVLLAKLRPLKSGARLRHIELLNTYMIAQGRFARGAAREGAEHLLRGISEGSDQISETVVSMITQCFVQAVNLKELQNWVNQPLSQLIETKKIYLLNDYVGYNNQDLLNLLLAELMKKAREQQIIQSSKLRIYSQIVRKILASITIFRFNDYFYKLLKDLIVYVLERPSPTEDEAALADQFVINQLCDSQYPEEIYKDLLDELLPMAECTAYVIKKKLIFLQGLVIHRSFRLNKIQIPPLLSLNEKQINLDFIITVSTMCRLMNNEQFTLEVQRIIELPNRKKHETYKLIAMLMAAGVREFEWKEKIVRDLIKHKKDKLVKQSISEWWKGKSPQSEQQKRIAELVRNFENPYSYFA